MFYVVDNHLSDVELDSLVQDRLKVLRRLHECEDNIHHCVHPVHRVAVCIIEESRIVTLLERWYLNLPKTVEENELELRLWFQCENNVDDQHFHRQHHTVHSRVTEQSTSGFCPRVLRRSDHFRCFSQLELPGEILNYEHPNLSQHRVQNLKHLLDEYEFVVCLTPYPVVNCRRVREFDCYKSA